MNFYSVMDTKVSINWNLLNMVFVLVIERQASINKLIMSQNYKAHLDRKVPSGMKVYHRRY